MKVQRTRLRHPVSVSFSPARNQSPPSYRSVRLTSTIILECLRHSREVNYHPPPSSHDPVAFHPLHRRGSFSRSPFASARSVESRGEYGGIYARKVVSAINKDEAAAIKCGARRSRFAFSGRMGCRTPFCLSHPPPVPPRSIRRFSSSTILFSDLPLHSHHLLNVSSLSFSSLSRSSRSLSLHPDTIKPP